ncbi:MAG: sel1 repeat family protein [Sphingomonas sp.]|uniref:tetratricopeptide repeat protein n=1 Tax=Sphingomonas sp. TaxID=28214 RepID=UPI0025E77C9E|nr:tetratricopeptide repeat protein [Sphingomonas sp.]MBY0282467.1 sel1 repeat family protein [Sphingomonas sp.]
MYLPATKHKRDLMLQRAISALLLVSFTISPMAQATGLSAAPSSEAESFKAKVIAGDAYALYQLGWLYREGTGGAPKRPELYHRLILAAAVRGEVAAMEQLAYDYREGTGGVGRDYSLARKWYLAAFRNGSHVAEFGIGYMFHNGLGAAVNYDVAEQYYRSAASNGVIKAWNNLGVIYGSNKQQNCKAVEFYKIGSSHGDATAMANLASIYEVGACGKASKVLARTWYNKALAQRGEDEDTVSARSTAREAIERLDRPPVVASSYSYGYSYGSAKETCDADCRLDGIMDLQQQRYSQPPPPPPPPAPPISSWYATTPGFSCCAY